MNEEAQMKFDLIMNNALKEANEYLNTLLEFIKTKEYYTVLEVDLNKWQKGHLPTRPFQTTFKKIRKPEENQSFFNYLQSLEKKGELDPYLKRSIAYVFMRDFGQTLESPSVRNKVNHYGNDIKRQFVQSQAKEMEKEAPKLHLVKLYKIAKREGIEASFVWLLNKISYVSHITPKQLDATSVQRKLLKVIAGVVLFVLEGMDENTEAIKRAKQLDLAIKIGYSYGLTYPFIDDILDSDLLTDVEKNRLSEMVRDAILKGRIANLNRLPRRDENWLNVIYSELRDAFLFLKQNIKPEFYIEFARLAYVFYESQEDDRVKKIPNPNYTNEELYLPVILKSAYSRLIIPPMVNKKFQPKERERIFYSGIFNQLADDFNDLLDDWKNGQVTPFSYYLEYHKNRPDLINPWELYWAITYYLIHHVYQSDQKTCEVLLTRAINVQQRLKNKTDKKRYKEIMAILAPENSSFNQYVPKLIQHAEHVDFLDRGIVKYLDGVFNKEQKGKKEFLKTVQHARNEINLLLQIPNGKYSSHFNIPLIDAANYSIDGSGKRLRPVMAYMMGVKGYGLKPELLTPLLKSIEYMHTASLIFDDLPAQDNADIRRGKPTLHRVFNTAIAELTGLFLTMKAVEEQASLNEIDTKLVLELIQYSANMTQKMCIGQAMDLESAGKKLTLEELIELSYYKTSLGFEASLMMPAILAKAGEKEREALKKFIYHAGLVFQIKDDLLDVVGNVDVIGKPVGLDAKNKLATFPSVLGVDGAVVEMWHHYFQAIEALHEIPRNIEFLAHLLDYFINRQY